MVQLHTLLVYFIVSPMNGALTCANRQLLTFSVTEFEPLAPVKSVPWLTLTSWEFDKLTTSPTAF